ncbi:MAG: glycosyltransferase [Actinomycetota bacterium]|nr:glycosyltransferase [Actinomycetota bacterium]
MRAISPRHDLRAFRQTRQIIKRFRPDVVNCHSSKAGALGRLAVRSTRRRPAVVFTPNALALSLGTHFRAVEWVLGHLCTDVMIAVGDSERIEIIDSKVVPRERVAVVRPFIDTDWFSPLSTDVARREVGVDEGAPLIVSVGRLSTQKDPLSFAEIVGRVRSRIPSVKALWVGDGELRPDFEASLRKLGLCDSVHITGWQRDVRTYFSAADVVLFTSLYEGLPHAVAEALAMSRAVVATRVTGTVDVVGDGTYAKTFAPGDLDTAAGHVVSLLHSPDTRLALAKPGREYVRQAFSRERMRSDLLRAYARAFELQRARGGLLGQ